MTDYFSASDNTEAFFYPVNLDLFALPPEFLVYLDLLISLLVSFEKVGEV